MTLGPDTHSELRALVEAVCEETITPEQMDRLEALVLADPEAAAFYITYLHMQADLVREFGVAAPSFGGGDRAPDAGAGTLGAGVGGAAPPSVGQGTGRRPDPGRLSHFPRLAAALALAATIALGALGIARLRSHRPTDGAAPVVAAPAYPKVDFAKGLAMVVGLEGVEWEPDGSPRPSEGDLLPAGRFRFRSGKATLSMLTGVALVVEGPADLDFVSVERVVCHRGRLRARVPEGAEGFVVSGSGSAVIDLGTEFGMNVQADGTMRGKVFEGRVEAAVLNESGTLQRSRMMREKSNTFEIDPRNGQIGTGAGPEEFVEPSTLAAPALVLDPGYRSAVLESRPWGYWRFESMDGGMIPNEIVGRPPLRVNGPVRLTEPALGNRSVAFSGGKDAQYLMMDSPWRTTRYPGYAIELWCLTEQIGHSALVSTTAPPDTNFHQFLLELTSKDRGTLHQPASIRFLHRCPPGTGGGDNLYSHNLYIPFRWHHIVGQVNGDRMELVMDGEPTPPLSVDPEDTDQPSQFLLGRLSTVPKHGTLWERPLVGRMDEVAIYDRPLTIEEIRRHHRLGPRANRAE